MLRLKLGLGAVGSVGPGPPFIQVVEPINVFNFYVKCFYPKDVAKVRAPIKAKNKKGFEMASLEMIEPISLISYLRNHVGIHVDPTQVAYYWRFNRERGVPWAVNHPGTEHHIPLSIYGDGAKMRSTPLGPQKILGVFLSCPLWRPKSIRCSKWLVFAILEDQLYSWRTLHAIYRRIAWSLNILFVGLMPARDLEGKVMSSSNCDPGQHLVKNKAKFALTEVKGDWCYHKQLFRFKSSWKGGSRVPVCFLCRAMAVQEPFYFDVGPRAACWDSQYTLTDFLAEQMPSHGVCTLLVLVHSFLFHHFLHEVKSSLTFVASTIAWSHV